GARRMAPVAGCGRVRAGRGGYRGPLVPLPPHRTTPTFPGPHLSGQRGRAEPAGRDLPLVLVAEELRLVLLGCGQHPATRRSAFAICRGNGRRDRTLCAAVVAG